MTPHFRPPRTETTGAGDSRSPLTSFQTLGATRTPAAKPPRRTLAVQNGSAGMRTEPVGTRPPPPEPI